MVGTTDRARDCDVEGWDDDDCDVPGDGLREDTALGDIDGISETTTVGTNEGGPTLGKPEGRLLSAHGGGIDVK